MVLVRLAAIARAPKFGEYPRASIAASTLSFVRGETRSGKFRQRETVAVETPAVVATSCSVGMARLLFILSIISILGNLAVQTEKGKTFAGAEM